LLDAGSFACDFFVFDKTGPNAVSGRYFPSDVDKTERGTHEEQLSLSPTSPAERDETP